LRVALAAEEAAGVQAIRLVMARGHEVVAVLTGSGAGGLGTSVAGVARQHGLPVRPAELMRDPAFAELLSDIDLLLNVHSLHIADPAVVAAPRLGAFNLHPGPLPEYAGLHVVSWAIYEGRCRYGVTLHRMVADVDAGSIAFAAAFPIFKSDTGLTLMMRCVREGLPLVERLLTCAERGEPIPAIAQDLTRRRWFTLGPPDGGRLRWDRPAESVANFVRAADYRPFRSPWGAPTCQVDRDDISISVLAARAEQTTTTGVPPGTVGRRDGEAVLVAAADRWVRVERVRVGEQELDAAAALSPGQKLLTHA